MTTKTDVLIIGGGPVGLSCAYYLLKAGRGVALLDSGEIGKGSGAGNAGHIVPSHIIPLAAPGVVGGALKGLLFEPARSPFGLKISLDPAYLFWLLRFALSCSEANVQRALQPLDELGRLSAANFARLIAEERFDCAYQQSGLLFLYKTEKALAAARREGEFLQRHGVPFRAYDREEVRRVEPAAADDVLGGAHFTGDSSLDPAVFLALLRERVGFMGADLRPRVKALGFETAAGRAVKVKTDAGDFEAEQIILAAGAFTPALTRDLRFNVPLQPGRGYSATFKAAGLLPRHALLLGEPRVAVTPMKGTLRVTGRLEAGVFDQTPNPFWIQRIERAAREYLKLDENLEMSETWAGLRPIAPDGIPILGRSPRQANVFLATGHAMLGLSLAPGTGQLMAELLNGKQTTLDLRPFRLERF